ncbi:hypothetical protein D9C73_028594 [Collichthys lucidus]|uniref:Uncharacterized protein n=1 Tax=Collichthys lucidus TaxID=240159 RepID=A0A4U5TWD3_COLLU|nr:hypothetical protein D9C73_028594 [Collichthys lucidus]
MDRWGHLCAEFSGVTADWTKLFLSPMVLERPVAPPRGEEGEQTVTSLMMETLLALDGLHEGTGEFTEEGRVQETYLLTHNMLQSGKVNPRAAGRGSHGDYVQVLDSLCGRHRDYVQVLDSLQGRHRDYVQVLDSLRGRHGDYVQVLDSLRGRHRDYVQVLDSLRGRHRDYVQVLDSLRGRHRDYVQVLDSLRGRHRDYVQVLDSLRD